MNQIRVLYKSSATHENLILNSKLSPIPIIDGTHTLFVLIDESQKWHLQTTPDNPTRLSVFDVPISRCELLPQIQYETQNIVIEAMENKSPKTDYPKTDWQSNTPNGRLLVNEVQKVACSDLPVYIYGETGSGKELIAKMLHQFSVHKNGPFVALNCGSLPVELADSELFGHRKGAFTGATHPRAGAVLKAHQGTLFLDEVADLPLQIQVKLLRFLEQGEIRSVGSDTSTKVQVRILSATHKPLKNLVENGLFREDLYFRLAPITLEVPALRERAEDLPALIKELLPPDTQITPKALLRLAVYHWPGNVRELKHSLIRASLGGKRVLDVSDFQFLFSKNPGLTPGKFEMNQIPLLPLKQLEVLALYKGLEITGWKRQETADLLGIARSTLFEMMRRYKITEPLPSKNITRPAHLLASIDLSAARYAS